MRKASGVKKLAIKLAANVLRLTSGQPFKVIYGGYGHILMFHRVLPQDNSPRLWNNSYLEVTPQYLQDLILYFKKLGYKFLTLDQLANSAKNARQLRPFVIFTFDDGYRDNLTYALPVMKRHNVPMTVYITTDFPYKKAKLWWDALEKKILEHDHLSFVFNGQKHHYTALSQEQKEDLFRHLHNLIITTPAKAKESLLSALFTPEELHAPLHNVLSWDEIRQLAGEPLVTIGAHTVSHPRLSQLPEARSKEEITKSITRIEQKITMPVRHFAYPFGDEQSFGKREMRILEQSGILTATTTVSKNITTKALGNLLALPRIAVGMSMSAHTFDLIRYGIIPMLRNRLRP